MVVSRNKCIPSIKIFAFNTQYVIKVVALFSSIRFKKLSRKLGVGHFQNGCVGKTSKIEKTMRKKRKKKIDTRTTSTKLKSHGCVFFCFGDFCYLQYVQKYNARSAVKYSRSGCRLAHRHTGHSGTDSRTDLKSDSHTT